MKKVYHIFTEENGEMDWFFTEDGEVVAYWWCNDANWRGEYMGALVEFFGGSVSKAPFKLEKKLLKIMKKEIKKLNA